MNRKDFRVSNWLDTKTLEPKFGVQRRVAPRRWLHVVDGERVAIFDTPEEAQAFIDAAFERVEQ